MFCLNTRPIQKKKWKNLVLIYGLTFIKLISLLNLHCMCISFLLGTFLPFYTILLHIHKLFNYIDVCNSEISHKNADR